MQNGCYNWDEVANELGTNRTAFQCFTRYQRSLNTKMLRGRWTKAEDELLIESVRKYGKKSWNRVAAELPGRSAVQCLHRWGKALDPNIRRGRWTVVEDMRLTMAVKAYGHGNWAKIQRHVPGRTDVQCRERWANVLNPELNLRPWTAEEDEHLLRLVSQLGTGKWAEVAKQMQDRTDNRIWRRWKYLHSEQKADYLDSARRKREASVRKCGGRAMQKSELTHTELEESQKAAKRQRYLSSDSTSSTVSPLPVSSTNTMYSTTNAAADSEADSSGASIDANSTRMATQDERFLALNLNARKT